MKKKLIFSTLLLFGTMPHVWAQHEGIVLDMETRQPLAGVKVYTNTNKMYMTTDKATFLSQIEPHGVSLSRIVVM